jgi:hypothetical protein
MVVVRDDERKERRFCALIQLRKSSDMQRIAADVPVIMATVQRWSNGEMEQLCRANDGQLFGFLFSSKKPAQMLMTEFESCTGTAHGDSFIVFEIGEDFSGTAGFSRAWTWIQHH